jgi:ectoine hydroxylase-related dioxygenase (phytanoyl-CoA dioxygenase family)
MPALLNVVGAEMAPDEIARAIEREGYAIIDGLAVELAKRAREELAPHIEAAPYGHNEFLGARTKRVGGLLRKSRAVQALAIHPGVLAVADRILLPRCARYQLNFSGVMHLAPGANAQALHRDGVLYPFRHPCPATLMPAMWALSDFTVANGGTRLVPGSHLWAQDRAPRADEVVAAEMTAGSVLLYTSGILHGGGDNVSATVRTGVALQYALGWLRQEENQYLANPPEVARGFPERLQRLIGYDYGGPYLGFVNGDDPHRLLEDGYEGPASRSSPEVDAAAARMEWLRYGDLEPVATPRGGGRTVATLAKLPSS